MPLSKRLFINIHNLCLPQRQPAPQKSSNHSCSRLRANRKYGTVHLNPCWNTEHRDFEVNGFHYITSCSISTAENQQVNFYVNYAFCDKLCVFRICFLFVFADNFVVEPTFLCLILAHTACSND